jgi:hypothetical protein
MSIEVVERPANGKTRKYSRYADQNDALIASAGSGVAIRFHMGESDPQQIRNRFARIARNNGLVAHVRLDGDHVIAWAEKKP